MERINVPAPPPPPNFPAVDPKAKILNIKSAVSCHLESSKTTVQLETSPEEEARNLCSKLVQMRQESCWISFLKRKITPVIQDGPQCGLVALSMASQVLCQKEVAVPDIYQNAVSRGFTKQGEMFSATALCAIAKTLLDCEGCILRAESTNFRFRILHNLFQGLPLLVPYDRDHNNEPCCRQGKKAHWALLSGVVLCTELPYLDDLLSKDKIYRDEKLTNLYHCAPSLEYRDVEIINTHQNKIFVYANQGKSLRTHLWDLDILLESNQQLHELDPEIVEHQDQYILYDGTIRCGINEQIVCLS